MTEGLIAPRARRRLGDPLRLAVETMLFLVSSAALALAGHLIPAAVFAIIAIGTAVLVRAVTPGPVKAGCLGHAGS